MPDSNSTETETETSGEQRSSDTTGKNASLDAWVETMTDSNDDQSAESSDADVAAVEATGAEAPSSSEDAETRRSTAHDDEATSEGAWRGSLSPDTSAGSPGTSNSNTGTTDSVDDDEEQSIIGGGADAVAAVAEPLEEITETGVTTHTAAHAWLDYLVARLEGDSESAAAAVDAATIDSGGSGGQSTLTAHAADGPDWVRSQFQNAAERLRTKSHAMQRDLLTPLFQHLEIADQDLLAQNFTPPAIAEFIVQQTVSDDDLADLDGAVLQRPVLAGDPACGAGIFLVTLADRLRSVEAPPPTLIIGQDIDDTAAKASVVNMALHGIPGFIIQGDTLLNESERVWRVGPVAPDPADTLVRELDADVLPDGFGSFPEGTANVEAAADDKYESSPPDTFGETPYSEVPRSTALFDVFDRIDPDNGVEAPNIL